jgi:hypothetical protein
MTAATLWIEITIAGAIYLIGIISLFLAGYGVRSFPSSVAVKDYLPYISVAAVGASYLVGIIMHRITQLPDWPLIRVTSRLLGLHRFRGFSSAAERYGDLVLIWEAGSARLHRELDFQFGLLALFRSLIFSIPFTGMSTEMWAVRTQHSVNWGLAAVCLLLWVASLVAYRRQRYHFFNVEKAALQRLKYPSDSDLSS